MSLRVEKGMSKYDREKKKRYYLKNREQRLAYQNKYYRESKSRFRRRREVEELLEPEKAEAARKRLSEYNKAYYKKNKERIKAKRREKLNAGKAAQ